MGLLDWYDDHRKPSYYTFRMMVERLDGFTACDDVSFGDVRAFRFTVNGGPVYVMWTDDETERLIDTSPVLGKGDVLVRRIVTALDAALAPVVAAPQAYPSTELPVSITPVFVERL